jgi:hypothetical protein
MFSVKNSSPVNRGNNKNRFDSIVCFFCIINYNDEKKAKKLQSKNHHLRFLVNDDFYKVIILYYL